jgi:hypothetical protein
MERETLTTKWENTKKELNFHEQKLIESYLQFLRDTAEFFIRRGNKVFFRENTVVHWGEGGFGTLYIIGTDEDEAVLPDYISAIRIENSVEDIRFSPGKEITLANLSDIKYRMDQWL